MSTQAEDPSSVNEKESSSSSEQKSPEVTEEINKVEQISINFVVYPESQALPNKTRFCLDVPASATGADVKKLLKQEGGYASRWLQLVHLGRVVSSHEPLDQFEVRPPRSTIIVIPKPLRLQAKHDWWRHQERELMQPSIDAALGDPKWPPLFVLEHTPQSASFTHRHEVWMRRIAQLATIDIVKAVPEPSFVEKDETNADQVCVCVLGMENSVPCFCSVLDWFRYNISQCTPFHLLLTFTSRSSFGLQQTVVEAMMEERSFALNEVIAFWEESGWQLRTGVERLWNGERDPAKIVRMPSGNLANSHSRYVLRCILVTTNIHERELWKRNPVGTCPPEVILKLNKTLADSRARSDSPVWPPSGVALPARVRDFVVEHEIWYVELHRPTVPVFLLAASQQLLVLTLGSYLFIS